MQQWEVYHRILAARQPHDLENPQSITPGFAYNLQIATVSYLLNWEQFHLQATVEMVNWGENTPTLTMCYHSGITSVMSPDHSRHALYDSNLI